MSEVYLRLCHTGSVPCGSRTLTSLPFAVRIAAPREVSAAIRSPLGDHDGIALVGSERLNAGTVHGHRVDLFMVAAAAGPDPARKRQLRAVG